VAAAADEGITGRWKTAEGKALIDIYHCGEKICGRVAWLREPAYPADDPEGMGGKPRIDRNNPNPELRSRKVMGLQILEGFVREGENSWGRGTIYDAETGKTYKSRLTLISPDRLKLRGYIGFPALGKSSIWTRQK
jgi:uncharacterized protein (DUF2147 family)